MLNANAAYYKLKISLIILLSFLCVRPEMTEASLVVDPALIKLNLSQDRNSGTFVIKNTSDKEERYRAKTVHFIVNKDGGLQEIPPDDSSLAAWVKFNPKEFTIPPKSSRVVRFSVIPGAKLMPKEYWGAIEFMPLQGAKVNSKDNQGHAFNIQVLTVILVPIYGFREGTQYSGKITQLEAKQEKDVVTINYALSNTGKGILRLNGKCQIIGPLGDVIEESKVDGLVIFPNIERALKLMINKTLPPNKYNVRFQFKSNDSRSKIELSKEVKFAFEK